MREKRFVSIKEAARICGVSRRNIYSWIQQGYVTKYSLPNGYTRLDIKELIIKGRENRNREIFVSNLPKGAANGKQSEHQGDD